MITFFRQFLLSTLFHNSRYLTCLDRINRCVPVNPSVVVSPGVQIPFPNGPNPPKIPTIPATTCPRPHDRSPGLPIQNDFCCDKTCDSDEWAMVPLKIVNVRPPKFSGYQSFPVKNGVVDSSFDIYSPKAYSQTNR